MTTDATDQSAKLRQQITHLNSQVARYREMSREANSALIRHLRGEPVEGWLDPKPVEPESNAKLLARLNQAKNVSHSRYQDYVREHALRLAAEKSAVEKQAKLNAVLDLLVWAACDGSTVVEIALVGRAL